MGRPVVLRLGGNWLEGCATLVAYKDRPIVAMEVAPDGHVRVTLELYDPDGHRLARVRDGAVVEGEAWRYWLERGDDGAGQTLRDLRDDRVVYSFARTGAGGGGGDPDEVNVSLSLYLPLPGHLLETSPEDVRVTPPLAGGLTIRGSVLSCKTAIAVGGRQSGAAVRYAVDG
jgi:hypothetical protein